MFIMETKQGCQMICFQTKNPNWGKFWRALEWKMLVYFMFIWIILRSFGIPILWPFGNAVVNRLTFPRFLFIVPRKIWQP
jgi:hypothetical protein